MKNCTSRIHRYMCTNIVGTNSKIINLIIEYNMYNDTLVYTTPLLLIIVHNMKHRLKK